MVHGGLRYLENREFRLVGAACAERRALRRIAPHVVRSRPFLIPAYRGQRPSRLELEVGMWAYDAVALFRNTRNHRPVSARRMAALEPALRREGLTGGGLFFDCMTDDARLTLLNVLDAEGLGAVPLNYAQVTDIALTDGRMVGARVRDALTGVEVDVRAKVVINAAGPWSDEVSKLADASAPPRLRLTKGVHIVVPRGRVGHVRAVVLRGPTDGRVFFVLPWGDLSLIGTTDTDYSGTPDDVRPEAADVRYLLEAANAYFPAASLAESDVVSAFAGVRPLVRTEAVEPGKVSREHALFVDNRGLVTVVGGKLTTYRRMAREVVSEALACARLPARAPAGKRRALPGGTGNPAQPTQAARAIAVLAKVEEAEADALYWLHGWGAKTVLDQAPASGRKRAVEGLPYVRASVLWAASSEHVVKLEDLLVRRIPVAWQLPDGGAEAAAGLARLVQGTLGWSDWHLEEEVESYKATVARDRQWRV
jgi:glycerol-3-phosphate dehydrogenase